MKKLAWLVLVVVGCGNVKANEGGDGSDADGGTASDAGEGGNDNNAPTDIELSEGTVEEQAPSGSVVGRLNAVDADIADDHTFELLDDGGGLFSLDGAELEIAPDVVPNYEDGATVTITVKATDRAGDSVDKDLDIQLIDLLEVANVLDSGPGSLRRTIEDAPAGATILFETGLGPVIALDSQIVLDKQITIRGPQRPAQIILDGLNDNRIFRVAAEGDVTLQQLRMRRGSAAGGGAIYNEGTLLIERCSIEDSTATGTSSGGGIQAIDESVLTVRDTTFVDNTGASGGAIAPGSSTCVIERCTFEGNQATNGDGGAIVTEFDVKIVNSTFIDNSASGNGGALCVEDLNGTAATHVAFSTFTSNTAGPFGGAIYVGNLDVARIVLRGSLLTGNSATNGPDLYFGLDASGSGDHNVIAVAPNRGFTANGNLLGTAVTLAAPDDNGGFTETVVPAAGSVSIDVVPAGSCDGFGGALDEDQRGQPRPVADGCDAGSVER